MDASELVSRFSPLIKKNWLPLSLAALGMILFAYGSIGLFVNNKASSRDIVFEANSEKNTQVEVKTIAVDIEGAVVQPGLYKLPQESRIQDGLVVAGGLSAQADRSYVSKNLNLATKLTDGARVYIPFVGEAVGNSQVLNSSSQIETVSGLINVNTSSQVGLESLPGIGPVTAQKIIGARPYGSIQELLNKKIVGAKVFDQIKDKITAY